MAMHQQWIEDFESVLEAHRNDSDAFFMRKYMRDQFDFYGIRSTERKRLSGPYLLKSKSMTGALMAETVREMWRHPMREQQYFAMEMICRHRKTPDALSPALLTHMITQKSWWDTVDFIAANLVGWAFRESLISESMITDWNKSDNIWLIRTSIIFQLKYKEGLDWELLKSQILPHIDHPDFFIRKAIGWALRQHSYFDPLQVMDFVLVTPLSPLSKREALKALTRRGHH